MSKLKKGMFILLLYVDRLDIFVKIVDKVLFLNKYRQIEKKIFLGLGVLVMMSMFFVFVLLKKRLLVNKWIIMMYCIFIMW